RHPSTNGLLVAPPHPPHPTKQASRGPRGHRPPGRPAFGPAACSTSDRYSPLVSWDRNPWDNDWDPAGVHNEAHVMQLGRPKAPLTVTAEDRAELVRWTKLPKTSNALAQRARILLRCADGIPNSQVAREFRVNNDTVGKWRSRYVQRGLAGLLDEPRCGAPRRISDEQVEAVVNAALETMPDDATHWSTRSMGARNGLSYASVRRIWHAFGLQPHRVETFKLSTDPQFIEKVRD